MEPDEPTEDDADADEPTAEERAALIDPDVRAAVTRSRERADEHRTRRRV